MTEATPFFDEEKRAIATAWLQGKTSLSCECCGSKDWQLASDLVAPVIFNGGFSLGGNSYPHFMIICKNCANTKFFNAVIAGVLKVENAAE